MEKKFTVPTLFIIFGITGDLFKKKILESLFSLYQKDHLPTKVRIYGFGRRDWSDIDLREYIKKIGKENNINVTQEFLEAFYFIKGNYENLNDYKNLAENIGLVDKDWKFCSNKLFYLATPPEIYETILNNLEKSDLTKPCGPEEGWTRVILEKPFGTNLQTAKNLDKKLSKILKEEQIYRVDHYLAKETVRNILAFRFSNTIFHPSFSNKYIEKIEVKILEKQTANERGNFYDNVGALRDVGQNHALQLLALFTMNRPRDFSCSQIREKRADILENLVIKDIKKNTARAQYKSFSSVLGVKKNSKTETYFKLKAKIKNGILKNVPVYIEAGKGLKNDKIQIKLIYKNIDPCLCNIVKNANNKLTYKIKPKEEISMNLLVKKPGYNFDVTKHKLIFDYKKKNKAKYIKDYEQLLVDIIKGDQTLFVSTREILAQWKFVEPILNSWQNENIKLYKYELGENFSIEL